MLRGDATAEAATDSSVLADASPPFSPGHPLPAKQIDFGARGVLLNQFRGGGRLRDGLSSGERPAGQEGAEPAAAGGGGGG